MDISTVPIPLDPAAGGRGVSERPIQPGDGMTANGGRREPSIELAKALAAELSDGPVSETNELHLRVDEDLKEVVATVVDTQTGEVVKSYPPEEVISAAKKLKAMLGQILDRNV